MAQRKPGKKPLSEAEKKRRRKQQNERRRKQREARRLSTSTVDGPPKVRLLPNGRVDRRNAAIRLGLSQATLQQWAWLEKGPRFYMVGGRAQYELGDLEAFAIKHKREPAESPRPRPSQARREPAHITE
jgi:hypothetical protein